MDIERWPALPLAEWRATYDTMHMASQLVGKLALAMTPLSNHYWNIALHPTSRGLVTQAMRWGGGSLTAELDWLEHQLVLKCSDGRTQVVPLRSEPIADFYAATMAALRRMGVEPHIWTMPVEYPDPIRFEEDRTHRTYDPRWASAFWRALESMWPVFERFRAGFVGKCSPVHFFWGGFDLAVTRFSGRRAPERPGADAVTRESYSHEVISHGFWPGGLGVEEAAFYAYAAPEPDGFAATAVEPAAAFYSQELHEFILPYEAVRTAASPEQALWAFLETTYASAARLAQWDRAALERPG
jgi:hypothetical protein